MHKSATTTKCGVGKRMMQVCENEKIATRWGDCDAATRGKSRNGCERDTFEMTGRVLLKREETRWFGLFATCFRRGRTHEGTGKTWHIRYWPVTEERGVFQMFCATEGDER